MQNQTGATLGDGAQQHQSIRLFKNPLLEALTHVHPSLPFILWIPVVLYFAYLAVTATNLSVGILILDFAGGVFFWTLTEYLMHRYVFHFPAKSKITQYLVFLFHGIHHDDPQDPTRLVMPPVVSLVLAPTFYFGFKFIMGPSHCLNFFAGFLTGYLIYDYIHFATHHFRPRTQWGKTIKENHMKHHFLEKPSKWGVSSPLWDHVFRTFK